MALRAQPRGLQPHRATACADVPHDAVGAQLQARQRDGAHFLFGDQALVGLALVVGRVSQAEAHRAGPRTGAPQQHDIGVGEGLLRRLDGRQVGQHALVGGAQALDYCQVEIVALAFDEQQAGDAVRRVVGAAQHGQPVVLAQGLRQRVQAVRRRRAALPFASILGMDGDDLRVVPGQPHTCAGELQRRHIGQHLDRLDAQVRGQETGDAVAQRVAGGEHHAALLRRARAAYPLGNRAELAGEIAAHGAWRDVAREQRQRAGAADHQVRAAQVRQCGGAEARGAVVEHADDAAGDRVQTRISHAMKPRRSCGRRSRRPAHEDETCRRSGRPR